MRIGENTGVNLNKLIQQKPVVAKKVELAPVTPLPTKKQGEFKQVKIYKKKEDDESNDDQSESHASLYKATPGPTP